MLPAGADPNRRVFQGADYSPDAQEQMTALTAATDAPQAARQPVSDDSGGHWSGNLQSGVDSSWVRRAVALLGQDKVGSFEDLADPEHRKWIRRKMRKAKKSAKPVGEVADEVADEGIEETAEEEIIPTETEERRAVIPSGRIPSRSLSRPTTGIPGPGGWVPAGDNLWWPPYPTTAGPMARPELSRGGGTSLRRTLTAGDQAGALERR
jgi:hypothetical protein